MSAIAPESDQTLGSGRYLVTLGASRRWLTVAEILELTTPADQPLHPLQPSGTRASTTGALLQIADACQRELIERLLKEPKPERPLVTVDEVLARMREIEDEC